MNSPRYSCVKRDIIWDSGIRPVLYSPTDNKGERGKNKTLVNIPCIQYILYILKLLGDGCTCTLSLMCEFRVHGGLKFAVYIYMVQGSTMYWYRWHRLRCIQVFFELFYTILVINDSIFIDCVVYWRWFCSLFLRCCYVGAVFIFFCCWFNFFFNFFFYTKLW